MSLLTDMYFRRRSLLALEGCGFSPNKELEEAIAEDDRRMDALSPQHQAIIKARFQKALKWNEIAEMTHYSMRNVIKIAKKGEKEMEDRENQ